MVKLLSTARAGGVRATRGPRLPRSSRGSAAGNSRTPDPTHADGSEPSFVPVGFDSRTGCQRSNRPLANWLPDDAAFSGLAGCSRRGRPRVSPDASGLRAGGSPCVVDAARRRLGAGGQQVRRDEAGLRVVVEVLRARGSVPARPRRAARGGGRVRRRPGRHSCWRVGRLRLGGALDQVPPGAGSRRVWLTRAPGLGA